MILMVETDEVGNILKEENYQLFLVAHSRVDLWILFSALLIKETICVFFFFSTLSLRFLLFKLICIICPFYRLSSPMTTSVVDEKCGVKSSSSMCIAFSEMLSFRIGQNGTM